MNSQKKLKKIFFNCCFFKEKYPKLYDGKTEFFKESQSEKSKTRSSKEEKVTIGDIERKVMLEKGGKFEELDVNIEHGNDFTYNEEMKSIKDSYHNDVNDVELEDDKELKDEAETY